MLELLGFEIDSLALMIRLPMRKLQEATAAMAGTKSGNTTTARVSSREACPCVSGGSTWEDVHEENVQIPENNQAMTPQDQAQLGVQVRPVMVHGGMEWSEHYSRGQYQLTACAHLDRCIGVGQSTQKQQAGYSCNGHNRATEAGRGEHCTNSSHPNCAGLRSVGKQVW